MNKYLAWLIDDVIIKTIRTSAQAAMGAIVGVATFYELDWKVIGGITGVAAITCVLMAFSEFPSRDKVEVQDGILVEGESVGYNEDGEVIAAYGDDEGEDNPTA